MKGSDSDLWRIWPSLQRSIPDPPNHIMKKQSVPIPVNGQVTNIDKPRPWRFVRWRKGNEKQGASIVLKKEKPKGNFYHKVLPNESLTEVSLKYDTFTEVLQEANGILNPNNVATGQLLWVPRTHLIQKGNTLWSLSRKYQVSIPSIQAANGIEDPNLIYAGDIIVIPEEPDNRLW